MRNKFNFFLLIAIITIAISCQEDAKVGLGFLPDSDALNFTINDTSTIKVTTVLDDSLATGSPSKFLLGVYDDPIFGRTKAEFATQLILNSASQVLPSYSFNGVADSLVVYLALDSINNANIYGNSDESFQINVYKLKKALHSYDAFYSNDLQEKYKSDELLGTTTFNPKTDKKIAIKLNHTLAQNFMDRANYYFNINDTLTFQQTFYGLYFSVVSNGNNSAIARISPTMSTTKMTFYYIPELSDTTYTYDFLINSSCVSFNLFKHEYENTTIENAVSQTTTIDSVAYLQSMGGTRIKVEFPYLNEFKKYDKLVVNKAELVVKAAPQSSTFERFFRTNDLMALVGYNKSKQLILLENYLSNSVYSGATYENGEYRFILTHEVQQMINNGTLGYDFYLIALQRKYNFERTIITTNKNSNPMKLILTYTLY